MQMSKDYTGLFVFFGFFLNKPEYLFFLTSEEQIQKDRAALILPFCLLLQGMYFYWTAGHASMCNTGENLFGKVTEGKGGGLS